MQTIKITADTAGIELALRKVSTLADSAKLSPEIVDRLLDLLNLGLEISGVELLTASGADELRVGLKLSDGFRENVSALLAGNIDGHAIQVAGHAGESITSG
jgi:hypothetical protein